MDIVDYHIFINLLVNYIRNNFVEHRQFALFFALVRTAILFSFFFCAKKNIQFNALIRIISQNTIALQKWKIKKQDQKIITKPTTKNCEKKSREHYKNLSED